MIGRFARFSPVGLEVASDGLRLLQVERSGDEGRVSAWAQLAPRNPAAEDPLAADDGRRLREVWRESGFRGRRVVVGLPAADLVVRHVKIEPVDELVLDQALLGELEGAFADDVPIVQHLVVGEVVERGQRRLEIILLAAARERVARLLEVLDEAGLEPVAIDAEPCALVRAYLRRRRRDTDRDRHTAIVHLAPSCTYMVVAAGDRALFMKQIPVGAASFYERLRQRLDLSPEDVAYAGEHPDEAEEVALRIAEASRPLLDPLVVEISACLRYHAASRRSPAGVELVLSGAAAVLPGVAEALRAALDLPIHRPDPFTPALSGVTAEGRVARSFSSWAVALGLALRPAAARPSIRRRRRGEAVA